MPLSNATVQAAIEALKEAESEAQYLYFNYEDQQRAIARFRQARQELTAYAATADEWETIPFGAYRTEAETVVLAANDSDEYPLYLAIKDEFGAGASCGLPAHWRLQRRVQEE